MDLGLLAMGAAGILVAATLGGISGFGYGLVATSLLLLSGLPLPQVVVVNLTVALVSRTVVVWRFHREIQIAKAGLLVAGGLPGICLGLLVVHMLDTRVLKVIAGSLAVAAAVALAWRSAKEGGRGSPRGAVVAGFAGGFLGPTTSLNGIAPAVILAHDGTGARSFIANLAAYFVTSNIITLVALSVTGRVAVHDIVHYLPVWVIVGIGGNLIGTHFAPRLPHRVFRRLVLAVIAVAGSATVITTLT